ncbi:chemotaxis protein MotB [Thalassobius vesicularis]|uniref:Chemotaxis protein MotB n=1 Tax=Thalassobius vesicularis TaxID=1294297 RepID=A0A4S3MCZ2_9RHOB|nr:flagellar motor protein MotB [Thalassobius vesicularis]THD76711.1 chemotaxis protein MotB [Thalassobius vesicularis]
MASHANAAPVIIKRKKVVGGDGHHGGAWKVAYADFVTAMMAFFMLMWLLNATTEKQRKGIADYFSPTVAISRVSGGGDGAFGGESVFSEVVLPQNGTGATNLRPTESKQARGEIGDDAGLDAQDKALREMEAALMGRGGESMMSTDLQRHIITRLTDEGLIVELFDTPDATLFEADSDRPTVLLVELSKMMVRVFGLVTNDVAVDGHTRAYPVVLKDNPVWTLSAARADRMRRLLQDAGMHFDRVKRVTGHADKEMAVDDPSSERNNRLEVILLREGL